MNGTGSDMNGTGSEATASNRARVYDYALPQLRPDDRARFVQVLQYMRIHDLPGPEQSATLLVCAHEASDGVAADGSVTALSEAFEAMAYATALDVYEEEQVREFRAQLDAETPQDGPPGPHSPGSGHPRAI